MIKQIRDWGKKEMKKIGKLISLPIILCACCIILAFDIARKIFGLTNKKRRIKMKKMIYLGVGFLALAVAIRIGLTMLLKVSSFSFEQVLVFLILIGSGTGLMFAGLVVSLKTK